LDVELVLMESEASKKPTNGTETERSGEGPPDAAVMELIHCVHNIVAHN